MRLGQNYIEVSILNQGKQLRDAEDLQDLSLLLQKSPNVEILTLQGNSLAPNAGKELARLIKTLNLNNIKILNFSDLFTGRVRAEIPPTLTYVFDALMNVGCKLEKIDLSDNAFGPDGAKPCIPLLKSDSCVGSLKELFLRFNNNGLGRGGVNIAKAIKEANLACQFTYPLEIFVAGRNRLENPGAKALANAINKLPKLKKFAVPQNGIRPAGIVALSNAIENCKTLEILDLSDNCMTYKGAIPMAKALKGLENLKEINFSDTLLRNRGIQELGEVLSNNKFPNLQSVNCGYGEIKQKYAQTFAEKMSKSASSDNNFSQEEKCLFSLNGNEIGEDSIEEMKILPGIKFGEFEDDEGNPDDSSDEEEYDLLTDNEPIDEEEFLAQFTLKNTQETAEKCTLEEFLAPNGATEGHLLGLSELFEGDAEKMVDSLLKLPPYYPIDSYRKLLDLYLLLATCLEDSSHTRTMDVLNNCTDFLFARAFGRVAQPSFVVNYLLTKIGLIKDENNNNKGLEEHKIQNLRGILLSLQHGCSQKYFPKECIEILKNVLNAPPQGADFLKKYHNDKAQLSGVLYRLVQAK